MHALIHSIRQLAQVADCNPETFLFFASWYDNLQCEAGGDGGVVFQGLTDLWIVVGNVLNIAIQVAGVLAVFLIIYGGIRYVISQGEPDNLQAAKRTIINSVVGLVIAILASTLVGFIAGRF